MSRLIDADALWKDITTRIEEYCDIADLIDIIERQPTIEPEQRWIPVTGRLPEYGAEALTINTDGDYEINHVIDEEDGEWFFDGAVAWMPLPPVYKENENERS